MKLENNLGTDAIRPLVLRIAIPSMLAQFVSVLYSIVDRIYISNIPLVGETALAGVGVCGPVVTLIGAFASLIGVGGAPLMSIRMGAGKTEEARRILSNSFLMLCVCSVALMAVGFPLRQPMLMAFGASDATYGYANTYFTVYLCGTVFNLLALGLNQFIICQGYARKGMISVMLGAALNIVLDPVFIFLFDMGVAGAAVATVLSQLVSCLYVLRFLFGKSVPIAITFGGYDGRLMLRILAVGMTPFLIIGVDNIMIISMNAILQSYGGAELGDRLVTCATIAQSFMLVVTMPLGGISAGTGTILAYNYGARRRDRILKAQAFIAGLCVAYVTALFLLGGGAIFSATPWFFWFGVGLGIMTLTFWSLARFFLRAGLGEYSTAFLRVVLLRWGGRLLLLTGLLYLALIVCKAPVTAILGGLTAGAATALITFAVASRNARR